jgi:hypothetical protein
MGSIARRRGAYGGEYLRAELRLHTRGGRRKAKELVKLEQKRATEENLGSWQLINKNTTGGLP